MTCLARRLWTVSAFFVGLLCCGVALAADGVFAESDYFATRGSICDSTALVGQRFGGMTGRGDVRVYAVGETAWALSACLEELLPIDALSLGADFGAGALAIDGNTVLAAAHRNEVGGATQAGSVFRFSRNGGTWAYDGQWAEPLPPGATMPTPGAQFGVAGDLNGDRAIVVASGTSMAYVYGRSGGVWDSGVALSGGTLDTPVAAAIDQQVAVVGSLLGGGHLDVWRRDGQVWNHEAAISAPAADSLFGADVDISGNTIVVSARDQSVGGLAGVGAVHVYQYDGGSGQWLPQQTIEHPEAAAGDAFGYSVAIEGGRLVVGAPRRDVTVGAETVQDVGAAYVYERIGSTWTQVDKWAVAAPVSGQWFGETVGVDDASLLVGGSGRTTAEVAGEGIVRLMGPAGVVVPGDVNRDGSVDEKDATILAQHWGNTGASWSTGDLTGDGKVDAADASVLAANWGQGSGEQTTGAAVPEPGTVVLLLGGFFGLLGLAVARRRRG